jgi:NADPH:quinone reductase-like Zn-dependent oxidoreductase
MRAVVVNEYDGVPEVVQLPVPVPAPGELLIKIAAAGMAPADWKLASTGLPFAAVCVLPFILGLDFAGTVVAAGDGSTAQVGDEVFGSFLPNPPGSRGTYAEFVAVAEHQPILGVVPLPANVSAEAAAGLPTPGHGALCMVEAVGDLNGKTVLVVGAGGAVGAYATQMAARAGAHVIATVRASSAERLRSYGAVDTIDHSEGPIGPKVLELAPEGVDVCLHAASDPATVEQSIKLVKRGGQFTTYVAIPDAELLDAEGVIGVPAYTVPPDLERLQRVAKLLGNGALTVPLTRRIRLEEAPDAVMASRTGHNDGKTVIVFDESGWSGS